jgi:DNA polymerase III delta subunit
VIHESDITAMVTSAYEKNIFDFIDALFSEKPDLARTIFLHSIETTAIYAFFYALLSNLRNTIFVNLFHQE